MGRQIITDWQTVVRSLFVLKGVEVRCLRSVYGWQDKLRASKKSVFRVCWLFLFDTGASGLGSR
jgi:hypothetical protein